jgi:hypothetical protein
MLSGFRATKNCPTMNRFLSFLFIACCCRPVVATGRAVPVSFRRFSGEFEYYRLLENMRIGHTSAVLRSDLFLVPDASNGCSFSYQNRSWVALKGRPQ